MQVSKWGNSLAVRLPATVVEALDLKEGDQIEIRIAGKEVSRDRSNSQGACLFTQTATQPSASRTLYSEDSRDGQTMEGQLTIRNPFAAYFS